jgi:hypothetical protein
MFKLSRFMATALAVPAVALAATATTAGTAQASSVPATIQSCGHHRACTSRRPSSFNPGYGLKIDRIKWHTYTSSKAVGWGRFGKHWRCRGNLDAEQMTCVKITLTNPVTRRGLRYFSRLLFQPATMGGYSSWSWRTARYQGQF